MNITIPSAYSVEQSAVCSARLPVTEHVPRRRL